MHPILSAILRRLHGPVHQHRISMLADLIVEQLQAQDEVVDVGCGSGSLARALLEQLQAIERARGRDRDGTHWGPRVLDLDLLAYGALSIDEARARGVPVIRDIPVARALADVEEGESIPEALFEAVAEILLGKLGGE